MGGFWRWWEFERVVTGRSSPTLWEERMLRESTFKLDAVKEKSGWDVRSKSTGKKLRLVVGFVCSKVVGSFGRDALLSLETYH